ncbi:MAG: 1-deoxy-D-xylulose-5-phosphate reductoisomerase [Actinobacteria bacterium]|uniref:1-deoxy-D-xylulose-5-phosphate reductoisomerase n=1 Tax=freshwater metagenome TaxID=449393 RepID=A0A6J7TLB2_9ZZZZ|nr:1-deoxy-D-xylulose-5-phosphate reductoisomerase [Actinomycetota bacterium]
MTRELVILGSTGSIGVQALEIVEANPTLFTVVALSAAGSNPDLLIAQAKKFKVKVVGVAKNADLIRQALPGVEVVDGPHASTEVAAISCDVVLNGITGSIGLAPTLAALDADNRVALANKESLVAGGDLVLSRAKEDQLLPVDSEHSAIWQALIGEKKSEISKLILTASGGPFRDRTDLSGVTVQEALAHPTWVMGPVVTINSATLMNKGLEIIEAHYLFGVSYSQIEAVIHPQSVIHSMVEFVDGSTIAQGSPPNMKGPISLALHYPHRVPAATAPIDWTQSHTWNFAPIDTDRFPSVALARECGAIGGGAPAIFNASNEVAVQAFVDGLIKFTDIVSVVSASVDALRSSAASKLRDLSDVSAIEEDARRTAHELVKKVGA